MKLTNNAFQLSGMADCCSPDSLESEGAKFLLLVQSCVEERLGEATDTDEASDIAHEIADGCIPVYTWRVWRVFTDLGAWQEDPTDLGCDGSDMEQAAKVCLYMIAERLVYALFEEATGEDE